MKRPNKNDYSDIGFAKGKYYDDLEKYCNELEEDFKDTLSLNGELINQNWEYYKTKMSLEYKVNKLEKENKKLKGNNCDYCKAKYDDDCKGCGMYEEMKDYLKEKGYIKDE